MVINQKGEVNMFNVIWIEDGKVKASQVQKESKVRQMIGDLKDKGIKTIAVDGVPVK